MKNSKSNSVFKNIYLLEKQIKISAVKFDHLLVTSKGIIVLEIIDYPGEIHGSENKNTWESICKNTQNNTKFVFENPVLPLAKSHNFIQKLVDNTLPVFSYVLTLNSMQFKTDVNQKILTFDKFKTTFESLEDVPENKLEKAKTLIKEKITINPKIIKAGKEAERKTYNVLRNFLAPSKNYFIYNNVFVKTPESVTNLSYYEIDHLVLCRQGIFVIETKGYIGIITGKYNSSNWTKQLDKLERKQSFRNPLKQNLNHVKALKDILYTKLDISYCKLTNDISNCVVFSNSTCQLKISNSCKPYVFKGANLLVKKITSSESIISQEQLEKLNNVVLENIIVKPSKELIEQHNEEIKKICETQ